MESAIDTTIKEKKRADDLGLKNLALVHNAGLYVLLMDRDFHVLHLEVVSFSDPWKQAYAIRQMALLIFESCDDLAHILGKDFRAAVMALGNGRDFLVELDPLLKKLSRFRKQHESTLGQLRNATTAHRELDALRFVAEVEAIDELALMKIATDFVLLTNEIIKFLTEVTEHVSIFSNLIRELASSETFLSRLKAGSSTIHMN